MEITSFLKNKLFGGGTGKKNGKMAPIPLGLRVEKMSEMGLVITPTRGRLIEDDLMFQLCPVCNYIIDLNKDF